MTTSSSLVTRVTGLLTVLLTAAGMAACTPRPDGPTPVAEQFFAALATGDTATAAELSDDPSTARSALNAAWAGLQAEHLDAQVLDRKSVV